MIGGSHLREVCLAAAAAAAKRLKTAWDQTKPKNPKTGIPSTVVIAASFDDVVAITGFSVFINIAITGQQNAAWQMASGPLQVLFGVLGGVLAGWALGCTRVWNTGAKRFIGIYASGEGVVQCDCGTGSGRARGRPRLFFSHAAAAALPPPRSTKNDSLHTKTKNHPALFLMFLLEHYGMLSGGALGALTVGLATCLCWEAGVPRRLSSGPSLDHSAEVERTMAKIWDFVAEPMLFATIGATFKFDTLPPGTIPRSVLIVVCGVVLRMIVTFFTMYGGKGRGRYSWRERLFYAVAWTPKATVQVREGGGMLRVRRARGEL